MCPSTLTTHRDRASESQGATGSRGTTSLTNVAVGGRTSVATTGHPFWWTPTRRTTRVSPGLTAGVGTTAVPRVTLA